MKKTLTFIMATTLLSTQASAQKIWKMDTGVNFTLKSCQRLPDKTVECSFDAISTKGDVDMYVDKTDVFAITPKGKEVMASTLFLKDQKMSLSDENVVFTLRQGINYLVKYQFAGIEENAIKHLDLSYSLGIAVRTVRNSNIEIVDVSRSNTAPAPRPATPTTLKSVKVGDKTYNALVHNCLSEGTGKATCYVSLLAPNDAGQTVNTTTLYAASLMKVAGQPVVGGKVNLTVGDTVFRDITVR